MARGAQKAQSQAKALEKAAGGKASSQKSGNIAAKSIICKVCRSTFLCTTKEAELKMHAENKHGGKKTFDECFAGWEKLVAAGANAVKNARKAAEPKKEKPKGKHKRSI